MSLLIDLLYPRTCFGCHRTGAYFCPNCTTKINSADIKQVAPYQGVLPLFHYRGAIKTSILDLKYHFISDLADELVTLMSLHLKADFPRLLQFWQDGQYTIIPIPLHPYRQNWRGFNQSEIVGRSLASKIELQYSHQCFFRRRYSSPQAKIRRKSDRLHHLGPVFSLNQNAILPPNLIIFDDVYTTGSTVKSLTSLIPENKSIWVLTIAG